MKGPLAEECDQLQRWFDRVYPQWQMTIHYKWNSKYREHTYYFELDYHTKKTLPLSIPEAWFHNTEMEQNLRENFLQKMQQKTMQTIG